VKKECETLDTNTGRYENAENPAQSLASGKLISLVELKALAIRLLKGDSTLRSIILSEPDYLPKLEALAKLEIFVRLLYHELRTS
jgi:hypothetical protein